jgi:hypothetical protein
MGASSGRETSTFTGNVNIHLMRSDRHIMSTRTTGTIHGFSVAVRFFRAASVVAGTTFALVLGSPFPVFAQSSLGTAQSYAVLGASTVTNTGPSVLTGDLGLSPGTAITGFPLGTRTGTTHAADAAALQAQNDVTTQYNALVAAACTQDLTGQNLGGKTLTAGVYCFSSSAQLTGTLILDAQGNAGAVFIFKMGSTLTTASGSSVFLINGGYASNVFWQVGSSATIGTTTSFAGNILALASITMTTGASLTGRALALTAAVTLDTNNISVPPPSPTVTTTNLSYSFNVPVAKAVVNPCSSTFVLINGNTHLAIATSTGSAFTALVDYASTGGGMDALASGALISDGTQKPDYAYSGQVSSEAGSSTTPGSFTTSIPIVDYLERSSGDRTDAFLMSSLFEIAFTNGVPGVPVLTEINVACVR